MIQQPQQQQNAFAARGPDAPDKKGMNYSIDVQRRLWQLGRISNNNKNRHYEILKWTLCAFVVGAIVIAKTNKTATKTADKVNKVIVVIFGDGRSLQFLREEFNEFFFFIFIFLCALFFFYVLF